MDQVRLDGRFADVQGACDLFVAQASSDEIEDLYLAFAEGLLRAGALSGLAAPPASSSVSTAAATGAERSVGTR